MIGYETMWVLKQRKSAHVVVQTVKHVTEPQMSVEVRDEAGIFNRGQVM